MTILEVTDGLFYGGGQKHILLLARHVDKSRFRLILLSRHDGEFRPEFERLNIPVYIIPFFYFFKILKLIKDENIELIHCHSTRCAILFRVAKSIHRRPVVITVHGYHGRKYEFKNTGISKVVDRLRLISERFLNAFADKIICVSEEDRSYMMHKGLIREDNSTVIYNGIDLSKVKPGGGRKGIGKRDITILCVARFHFQKGHKYLIAAIPGVLKKHPNCEFIFIGDGELFDGTQKQAYEELLLPEERVLFLGRKSDINPYLQMSDVFVLASLWEGLPIALIEAEAAGLAIVATDVPGNREVVVNGETGLLVPPRSVSDLENGLIMLIENNDLRQVMGEKALKRAKTLFDIKNTASKLEAVYQELTSNNATS